MMRGLTPDGGVRGVLALAAHPDDLEIACGGTLLTMARRLPGLRVAVVLLTGSPDRQEEAAAAAELFLPGCRVTLDTFTFPDGRLPAVWGDVKQALEDVAARLDAEGFAGDVVLAPRPDDAHQDHALLGRLAPTVWRDHLVLGYEIPKYDGDLGRPSVYVPLAEAVVHDKVRLLAKAYPSQVDRDWWDDETFLGLARLRGVECRARYAEAFVSTKAVLTW